MIGSGYKSKWQIRYLGNTAQLIPYGLAHVLLVYFLSSFTGIWKKLVYYNCAGIAFKDRLIMNIRSKSLDIFLFV